jgi:LysM repeat protein
MNSEGTKGMRLIKAFGAVVILIAVVVGPPWALMTFIGNPWPAEGVSLSAPLTDGAIIGLLAAVVWVLWIQLLACILTEAVAALTEDRFRVRVPLTLGVQQQLARRLVTAVVVAVVPTSIAIGTNSPAAPSAAPVTATVADEVGAVGSAVRQEHGLSTERTAQPTATTTVPVKRLDTLWDIAERVLGDGDRWPEIAALNEGREMNDGAVFTSADQIRPGWDLIVPADGPPKEVVVQPGDSLSGIAEEQTGDPGQWPTLYDANRDVIGDDPDLIYPGQVLAVPGTGTVDAAVDLAPETDRRHRPERQSSDDQSTGGAHDIHQDRDGGAGESGGAGNEAGTDQTEVPVEPSPEAPVETAPVETEKVAAAQTDEAATVEEEGGITALRALLASAALLSAGALGMVITNRRRQFRQRPIGRTIASTPDELLEVEQAILEHGTEAQEDAVFIDRALRHVAASCKAAGARLPQVGAAVLGDEDLTLLFTDPAPGEVPDGWTATDDARAWMLARWTFLEEDLEAQPAPYPALVSVGLDGGGRTWYLDLETLGLCGIGGEPEKVAGLARFMVAELAVNKWAEGCEVLLADQFAAETVRLNPARLRQVERSDALARAAVLSGEIDEVEENLGADVLNRRRDGLLLDTTNPVVVVLASRPEGEFVADVAARDRSRVVVVHGDEEDPAVELAGDGMAYLPMWGISVHAFTMQPEQAAPMADLIAATRSLEDEPVPDSQSGDGPLGKYARADGSLREEYTAPRRTEGNDPSSQLPEADEVYLATAATTAEDLAAIAPSVPAQIREEIAALDPTLDQDVADWFDENCSRPKVHLLGPVSVSALNGGDPSAIDNAGGSVSFIAYLACQDHGVTGERAAAAFGWKTQKTVQNRATNARFLLGTRPDGSDWLPDASMSSGARRGSTPTYELLKSTGGVLTSPDLFVRLKLRAQARGDEGCEEDLVTALSLITGAPFEAATESRFKWLFKPGQQRHDEILVGAVHDAAHTLATRAVAEGRTDLVRVACDAARLANPHADIAWLDQAAAVEAESGRAAAGELVREQVLDRLDEDLPSRSEKVVEQREWGAAG